MRRRVTIFGTVAAGVLVAFAMLAAGADRRIGTRALLAVATVLPPGFSSLLSTMLGIHGSGSSRVAEEPETDGADRPILVVTSSGNPFSRYLIEILRAEGLNEVASIDLAHVTAARLRTRDVVVLGEMTLTPAQVGTLSEWTQAGGTLIAMRPEPGLAPLLGLAASSGTLADAYLQVDTRTGAGVGIVGTTMQFHGAADLWSAQDATTLATLYVDAQSASGHPAVTSRRVGTSGGVAAAFTYDLARSVVYTRQGNPAWAGQHRIGLVPRRVVDLFYGNAADDPAPDWLDFDKLAIPQADEQQRLLANLVLEGSLHRKPLPRWWYLPKGANAAVVMTGDDHGSDGVRPRFERYRDASPSHCSVDDWECVRATAYVHADTTLPPADAERYTGLGFEIAPHLTTACRDWSPLPLDLLFGLQLRSFRAAFPRIPAPATNRTHCAAWSDWSTEAEIEATYGIRLDTNYYFYPSSWVQGRNGLFTGSGFPMRFAARDGSPIDCYQAATQLTDESDLALPQAIDQLLDRADGPEGFYGVFTTNMHFDQAHHPGSDAIVESARAHHVPVVSARQMLTWLDGRARSSFDTLEWNGSVLSFTAGVGTGARNLRGMLPLRSATGALLRLEHDGNPVAWEPRTIKGRAYAFFAAEAGPYSAVYAR